jgi:tRNA pseudouridine38-40 synthase
MKKVGKGFDMRHDACTRVYNYIAPLKLFLSKEQVESGFVLDEIGKEELLCKLNQLAAKYVGTRHYHNFTKGYKMDDPRCDRYVLSVTAEHVEPEVVDKYLEEEFPTEEERKNHRMSFIRFTLIGQSFIYHQIRKMIGLLIKICY